MSVTKVIFVGVFAVSSLGFATTGHANSRWDDCLDVDFADTDEGECIPAERQDNGFGNGDDIAPGQSLENNNAENAGGDTETNPNPNGMGNAPGNSGTNSNPNK